MPQSLSIPLPKNGVNRVAARSEQDPETTWFATNVLPYDRYGRLRIGQRPGTARVYANSPSGTGEPNQMLRQITLALNPATLQTNATLLNETFTYADGFLGAVASGIWSTTTPATSFNLGGATSTVIVPVSGNKIVETVTTSHGSRYVAATLATGSQYLVQASVTFSTLANLGIFAIQIRVDSSNLATSGISCRLETNSGAPLVRFTDSAGTLIGSAVTLPSGAIVANTPATFRVTVNSNAILIAINDITFASVTSAVSSTFAGVGFVTNSNAATTTTIDNFQVFTGMDLTSYRKTYLVAIQSGNVYAGNLTSISLVLNGTGAFTNNSRPQGASIFSKMYIVNGLQNAKVFNADTFSVSDLTPTAGTETATTLGRYQLSAAWRGRLVLGADRENPQNFVMSRVGVPTDFDYSQTDPATAFAGNASQSGQIGEPITALMPAGEDLLLIGCDHSIWKVEGDPADGGSILPISRSVGVFGADAWAQSPDGMIYFVGSAGFYRVAAGGQPENLSAGKYSQVFTNITRNNTYVQVAWDRDRIGAWVFLTPFASTTVSTFFYDARNGGFWPMTFPTNHGPLSTLVYDGDDPNDRQILFGGRVGVIYRFGDNYVDDDAVQIVAGITLGPFQPAPPVGDSLITRFDVTLGEPTSGGVFNADWTIEGGKSAYEVTEGSPRHTISGNFTSQGRQLTRAARIRGGWFSITFSNSTLDTYFSLERVVVQVAEGGNQR